MLIKRPPDIKSHEITPESVYLDRRRLLQAAGISATALVSSRAGAEELPSQYESLGPLVKSPYSTDEEPNSFDDIASYNNFYEFGMGKDDPRSRSGDFKPQPWSVTVDGEAEVTGTFTYEDIVKPHPLEEHIEAEFRHLAEVCRSPRTHIRIETERVLVSRRSSRRAAATSRAGGCTSRRCSSRRACPRASRRGSSSPCGPRTTS